MNQEPKSPKLESKTGMNAGNYEVHALRWFGRGRVLCEALETGVTSPLLGFLPGEKGIVEVGADGMFRNGKVVELHEVSPHRVEPACSQFGRCPGCATQHVSREERARYAQTLCAEVLERFGDWPILPESVNVVMGEEGGHRERSRLRIRRDVRVENFALEVGMAQWPDASLPFADFSVCVANHESLRWGAAALKGLPESLWLDFERAGWVQSGETSVELELADGKLLVIADDAEQASSLSTYLSALEGAPRAIEVGSPERAWSHANPSMQDRLYDHALSMVDVRGKTVWDLTCGEGGFSLAMARRGAKVFASDRHWEAVQRCTRAALENAEGFGAGGSVITRGGDALSVLKGSARRGEVPDIVVINPMREPLGEEVMEAVDASGAKFVLYLAPAPKAGSRDFFHLRSRRWTLGACSAVDLHPWTGQVMMVFCALRATNE